MGENCYYKATDYCKKNNGNPCSSKAKIGGDTTFHNICDGCTTYFRNEDMVDEIRPLWAQSAPTRQQSSRSHIIKYVLLSTGTSFVRARLYTRFTKIDVLLVIKIGRRCQTNVHMTVIVATTPRMGKKICVNRVGTANVRTPTKRSNYFSNVWCSVIYPRFKMCHGVRRTS